VRLPLRRPVMQRWGQFLYYDASGVVLTDPAAHGPIQGNGQPALTASKKLDNALAAGREPFLFETPGNVACFRAASAMARMTGAHVGGPYQVFQIFYNADEEDTSTSKGRQFSRLRRSDPGRLREIAAVTAAAVGYIMGQLVAGRAVVVGTSYWRGTWNTQDADTPESVGSDPTHAGESRADHYVAIMGREANGRFVFHDPGSEEPQNRASQHFVIDASGVLSRDPAEVEAGGLFFEVSQVRLNT
jgi:hypothetical protein